MLNHSTLQKLIVLFLVVATICASTPVSAAELTSKSPLGTITGIGLVHLRGLPIAKEGTLFVGDKVNVGAQSAANVVLLNGQKITLDQMSSLSLAPGGQLQLGSGNLAFSTKSGKLDIVAGRYEISGDKQLSGNVAFIGTDYVGIRVLSGTATVQDLQTKQTHKVTAGQERIFSATTGASAAPIAQVASTVPTPLPAVPPIPAPPQAGAGRGLTKSGWIAILATIGGAAAAIAVLATRGDDDDSAAILARQRAQQAVTAATSNAQTATTTAATVTTATTNVSAAINNSNISAAQRTQLTAQATNITSQVQATQLQIAALTQSLTQFQNQLANVTDPAAIAALNNQINNVINNLNSQTTVLNQQIAALNTLVQQAQQAGVQNVPTVVIPTVPSTQPVASGS